MSVNISQYILYGIKIPYDLSIFKRELDEDMHDLDELLEESNGVFKNNRIEFITDGMNGEYIYFGWVWSKSTCDEPLESTIIPIVEPRIKAMVQNFIDKEMVTDAHCGYHFITHYG